MNYQTMSAASSARQWRVSRSGWWLPPANVPSVTPRKTHCSFRLPSLLHHRSFSCHLICLPFPISDLMLFPQIVILPAWLGAHFLIFTLFVASQTLFWVCFYKKAFSSHFYCPPDRCNPFSFIVALLGASFYCRWNHCHLPPCNQNYVSLVYMIRWREPFTILPGMTASGIQGPKGHPMFMTVRVKHKNKKLVGLMDDRVESSCSQFCVDNVHNNSFIMLLKL